MMKTVQKKGCRVNVLLLMISVVFIAVSGFFCPAAAAPSPDNGVQREYYPGGQLRLENRWKNERIVRKRSFYRNGRVMSDYQYKNGTLVRIRTYYESGRLKSDWRGKTGETRHYYEDGSLRISIKQSGSN